MKVGSTLTYLHGDHLGSTVLETNVSGAMTTDEKYFAYGKQRDTGKVATDNRFTGQKEDGSGLQYFNARYYDPSTGLFVGPDTIVPDAGLALAYNRSMYVLGRVMNANDPSGHQCFAPVGGGFGGSCVGGGGGGINIAQGAGTAGNIGITGAMVLIATADALNSDQGEKVTPTAPASPVLSDPLPEEQKPVVTTFPMAGESPSVQLTGIIGDSSTQTSQLPGFTLTSPSASDNIVSAKVPALPVGMKTPAEFGKFMGWGTGNETARSRSQTVTLGEMLSGNMTIEIAKEWRDFYANEIVRNPNNPSAQGRKELMERVVELLSGE